MSAYVTRRTLVQLFGGGAAAALLPAGSAALSAPPVPAKAAVFAPAPGIAMLQRNENPYGPAPSAVRAVADMAANGCYYANTAEKTLAAMIAERHGLTPEHVMMGSGSTEVLIAATMELSRDGHILAPALFFDPPVRFAEGKGAQVVRVPLGADMGIDLAAMQAATTPETRLVHLCNPNNPTGMLLAPAALRAFIAAVSPRATVLVDEAYNELTDAPATNTMVDRVRAGDNVIVARTFSKLYGMAGLRVGYALARPDLIARLKPWATSVGGNTAGLAGAMASFDDQAFLAMSRARILEGRAMLEAAVTAAGLTALPSQANFLFVKVPDAEAVRRGMEARNILIRGAYGPWTQWSRVSTGKLEDIKRYADALPDVLAA